LADVASVLTRRANREIGEDETSAPILSTGILTPPKKRLNNQEAASSDDRVDGRRASKMRREVVAEKADLLLPHLLG
jgi:hypothetical protein